MTASRRRIKMEESQNILDVAGVMAAGTGPFTRKMLAVELHKLYPNLSHQELMVKVSDAIQSDRYAKKRFKIAGQGWWDLRER